MKKLILFALLLTVGISASAQLGNFYNPLGNHLTSDTLTLAAATGTVYLTTESIKAAPATSTTVRFKVTEYSGTTSGTATLMGSFDGTNFKAITTPNTVTALATHTVADAASAYYDWIITGSPYPYLRVSWTATTATFSSKIEAQFFRSK
jgi:hypothetical protein